jgi:uridine kinase
MKPLIIGIAGGTGSGKSTVARKVAEALPDAWRWTRTTGISGT